MAGNRSGPVSVGLVAGGSWAKDVHAPIFSAGPETRLAGVWSRAAAKAEALAASQNCRVFAEFDELLDECELVSFAVAPAAQPTLATSAALAGRHVLLEKPVAACVEDATNLADILAAQRVRSLLFLTYSFSPLVRQFVDGCRNRSPVRARLLFSTTAHPSKVTGWRRDRGLLLDLGFHVFDLLDAVGGRIVRILAHGDRMQSVDLRVEHAAGCVSEANVSWAGLPTRRTELNVLTEKGTMSLDPTACTRGAWLPTGVRQAVWGLVRENRRDGPGIEHGVYLQQCVGAAERSLSEEGAFVLVA
jgi:predicted dehydrogenase